MSSDRRVVGGEFERGIFSPNISVEEENRCCAICPRQLILWIRSLVATISRRRRLKRLEMMGGTASTR
jgi:hypothetical protein